MINSSQMQFEIQFLGIIGYANKVYEILSAKPVNHTDDDQLYYTQIYLDHRVSILLSLYFFIFCMFL